MSDTDLLAKRVRRCEVVDLDLIDEVVEMRACLRAVYECLAKMQRRLPPASTTAEADPMEILMNPPWHVNEATGNVLPPPFGFDVEQRGLAAFRMRLKQLSEEQRAEVLKAQQRHSKRAEILRKREAERKAKREKTGKGLPDRE